MLHATRLFVTGCALATLTLGGCGSDDEVVMPTTKSVTYQEDFEGYKSGETADKQGWQMRGGNVSALDQVISEEHAHGGSRSLRLLSALTSDAAVERNVGALGETLFLEGYLMASPNGAAYLGIEGIDGAADSGGSPLAVKAGVNAKGVVELHLGSQVFTTSLHPRNPYAWLGIKLRINLFRKMLDLEARYGEEVDTLSLTPSHLGTVIKSAAYRLVCSAGGPSSRAYFDDLEAGKLLP